MLVFKWIPLLVIVILNFVLSSASLDDVVKLLQTDYDMVLKGNSEKRACTESRTIEELNKIIARKFVIILKLSSLEKKLRSRKRIKSNKKLKSQKSSSPIQNQIFVQFFGRNQTSVELDRQPFKIANVPQTAPKIDIGKLNWTDASFDKNPSAIDYAKITVEELKKTLEEVMKRSKCPLGTVYDARKGCISIETFGLVPEVPRTVNIEGLFNQPLGNAEKSGNAKIDSKVTSASQGTKINSISENQGNGNPEKESQRTGNGLKINEVSGENASGGVTLEQGNGKMKIYLEKFIEVGNGGDGLDLRLPEKLNLVMNNEGKSMKEKLESNGAFNLKFIDPEKLILVGEGGDVMKMDLSGMKSSMAEVEGGKFSASIDSRTGGVMDKMSALAHLIQSKNSMETATEGVENQEKITGNTNTGLSSLISSKAESTPNGLNILTSGETVPESLKSKVSPSTLDLKLPLESTGIHESESSNLQGASPGTFEMNLNAGNQANMEELQKLLSSYLTGNAKMSVGSDNILSVIDEGEIPIILNSITKDNQSPGNPKIEFKSIGNPKMEIISPEDAKEIRNSNADNAQISLTLGDPNRQLMQNMSVNTAKEAIEVHPEIVKETFPIKATIKLPEKVEMSQKLPSIKLNLPVTFTQKQLGGLPGMEINANNLLTLDNNMRDISLTGNEGNSMTTEAVETSTQAEKLSKPKKRPMKQAFLVHHVPIETRKSAEEHNEEYDEDLNEYAPARRAETTAPPAAMPVGPPPGFIPKLVDSAKTIQDTNKKILSNFFPTIFGGRLADESKENIDNIRKNVPIIYESVEGKTLADNLSEEHLEEITESLKKVLTKSVETSTTEPTSTEGLDEVTVPTTTLKSKSSTVRTKSSKSK